MRWKGISMIIADCHVHSEFSADSDTPMERQIERAIQSGLKILTFTDHYDLDFPKLDGQDFLFDIPEYFDKITSMRQRYEGKIQIRYGIELGIQPHLGMECHKISELYDWDFIIASTHLIFGLDPYYKEVFEKYTEKECYEEYFRLTYENMKTFSEYSTYGHLDYIVRYGPNKNREYSYERYKEWIDKCLMHLIEQGKALEVNTSGYRSGLGYANPQADVLVRYRELGGELLTIGSDSHAPEQIAYDFKRAEQMLKEAGFRYYAVYHKRQPELFKL